MRNLPPLSSVRVFEAAARHQNFTQAAGELGMTQAAVSYQIRLLEERLGLPLFSRSKGRVSLTESGRRIAPLTALAFDTLEEAFSDLVADDGALLSLSAIQSLATNWLAPRLGSFQIRHPTLAVRLSTDNRLVDFSSGEFHAAIRLGTGGWQGLRCHFLFRSHLTPMCSPDFARRHNLQRPEQLLDVPWLSPTDGWWLEWLRGVGVEARPVEHLPGLVMDSQLVEAGAAIAGSGIAMMPPLLWRSELASGRLVQPFDHLYFPGTSHWLVYPESRRSQPKIQAFRSWLSAEVDAMKGAEPSAIFAPPPDQTPKQGA